MNGLEMVCIFGNRIGTKYKSVWTLTEPNENYKEILGMALLRKSNKEKIRQSNENKTFWWN